MRKSRSLNQERNFQSTKLTNSELRSITGGEMGPGDKDGTGNQGGIWDWFSGFFK